MPRNALPQTVLAFFLKGLLALCFVMSPLSASAASQGGGHASARDAARAVFQILAAEFALQAGDPLLAAGAYLGLARQTQDAGVAERATQLALAVRSPTEALETAEIWLQADPNNRSAQQTVDLLQLLLGQENRLVASLRTRMTAAQTPQERAALDESLGQLALRGPIPEQGIRIIDRVYGQTALPSTALYAKAMLLERRGLISEMEQLLRGLLAQDPNHAHALNALGYSLVDRQTSLEEAYGLIRKAHALEPQDPHIMDSLGWAYFRLQKPQQALRWLREAYRRLPDAEIAAHLGEVLWTQGQPEDARRIWAEAQQRSPQNRVLLETLQRVGHGANAQKP
ncbi:MAG: tetratricopeptide repeat protein [Burkholderiaceae bacterium]